MEKIIRELWISPLDGLILNGSNYDWAFTEAQWRELLRIGKALVQLAESKLLSTINANGREFFEKMTGKPIDPAIYEAWADKVDTQAEIAKLRSTIRFRNRQIRDLRRSLRK